MPNRVQIRDRLLGIIDQFERRRILVAGDLISDQFLYGRISRISREAPVLILEYSELVCLPGGAANAANNLLALGAGVVVAGAVGADRAGRELVERLKGKGADVRHVARVENFATPVKTRILAGAHHSAPQQIVRIDRESFLAVGAQAPWGRLARSLRRCDAVIVSDYGYGAVFPDLMRQLHGHARRQGLPIVVDSRFRMGDFHGVTSMTPNITELEACAGVAIGGDARLLNTVARKFLGRHGLSSILVTQGRFGMTLFEPRRRAVRIPPYGTDEVADVTGAGDTVIAVFSLALASDGSHEEAARLANYAGGIVVMKRGTATASREELVDAVRLDLSS